MKGSKKKKSKHFHHDFNLFNAIDKLQLMYKKLYNGIYNRFDLQDDIKQGKVFTIILVFLFILAGIITIFILFNSLIGINLIYSLFKYTFIFVKEFYKIIKTKGELILKYLHTKFDSNYKEKDIEVEIKKEEEFTNNNETSLYNEYVLNFIEYLNKSIDYLEIDNLAKGRIVRKMQEVVLDLSSEKREIITEKLDKILKTLLDEIALNDEEIKKEENSNILKFENEEYRNTYQDNYLDLKPRKRYR